MPLHTEFSVYDIDGLTIEELINKFKEYPSNYSINIDSGEEYGRHYCNIEIIRPETEEEIANRIAKWEAHQEDYRTREIKQAKEVLRKNGITL